MSRTRLVLFQRGNGPMADGGTGLAYTSTQTCRPARVVGYLDTPVQALADPLVRVQAVPVSWSNETGRT